jgi:hypothetical protein
MEIPIDEDWLKTLYEILVRIYQDTDRPVTSGFPLVLDFDESMISVCVERPKTKVFGITLYPHTLQRAAVLMHSIINFHPPLLMAIRGLRCWLQTFICTGMGMIL